MKTFTAIVRHPELVSASSALRKRTLKRVQGDEKTKSSKDLKTAITIERHAEFISVSLVFNQTLKRVQGDERMKGGNAQ